MVGSSSVKIWLKWRVVVTYLEESHDRNSRFKLSSSFVGPQKAVVLYVRLRLPSRLNQLVELVGAAQLLRSLVQVGVSAKSKSALCTAGCRMCLSSERVRSHSSPCQRARVSASQFCRSNGRSTERRIKRIV